MKNGIVVGIILVLGLFGEAIGLPLLVLYLFLFGKKPSLNRKHLPIVLLILLKVLWITVVSIVYNHGTIYSYCQIISVDIMILLTIFIKKDKGFYKGLFVAIALLFAADLTFNIWIYLFGADPLGRIVGTRPDDFFHRTGGVFFHAFYSINISFIVILFSIFLRHRLLLLLAILNIASNGSYRGVLTLMVFAAICFLLMRRVKFKKLVVISIVMVAAVVAMTVISIDYLGRDSANYYRVFAWGNAIENIMIHPIVGTHTFSVGELSNINKDTFKEFGIAESAYLNYALHYGIFPAIAHLIVILFIFSQRVRLLYSRNVTGLFNFQFIGAAFSGVVFIDTFYGTVLGSMLTTMCYGLICISSRDVDKPKKLIQHA